MPNLQESREIVGRNPCGDCRSVSGRRPKDSEKILQALRKALKSNFDPNDFVALQIKINAILERYLKAESACLMFPTKDVLMAYINVLGKQYIGPTSFSIINTPIQRCIRRRHIVPIVDKRQLYLFRKIFRTAIQSITLIPISLDCNTSYATIVVCLANQKQRDKFDSKLVQEIFKELGSLIQFSVCHYHQIISRQRKRRFIRLSQKICDASHLIHTLTDIMMEAKSCLCAEMCSFFIIDAQNDVLIVKMLQGVAGLNIKLPLHQGIFKKIIITRSPIIVNDICQLHHHYLFQRGLKKFEIKARNMMCFPIVERNKVIAIGEFSNKIGDSSFNRDDLEMCQHLADVIKKVIYNTLADCLKNS